MPWQQISVQPLLEGRYQAASAPRGLGIRTALISQADISREYRHRLRSGRSSLRAI